MARFKTNLHPLFKRKAVIKLFCKYCDETLCGRAMKAILLADKAMELYSTDQFPEEAVATLSPVFSTQKCSCKIKQMACLRCGNVVGYTVIRPCQPCLYSCNNGHFWVFHSTDVFAVERIMDTDEGVTALTWAALLETDENPPDHDEIDFLR